MLDPNTTPEEAKYAILATLFQLSEADDEESDPEFGYILHVAKQLGVESNMLDEISANRDSYLLVPPSEEQARIMILYYFLFFLSADGQIHPAEEKMVLELSFKLGFRPSLAEGLISVLKTYLNKPIPSEDLLDKIRAYLN